VGVTGGAWRAKAESLESRYHIRVLPSTPTADHPQVAVFLKQLADAVSARTAGAAGKPAQASRLKQVVLENVGPFDRLALDLSRDWNVILGDNGVGKSSILKAIAIAVCGQEAARFADRLIKSGRTHATITLVIDQDKTYTTRLVMRRRP
jgi:hypothetical protein